MLLVKEEQRVMTGTHHISLTSHINHITRKIIPTHLTQHLTHAHQLQATLNTVTMPLGNKSSIIKVNVWVSTLAPPLLINVFVQIINLTVKWILLKDYLS